MQTITGGGAFTRQNIAAINSNFTTLSLPFTPGKVIWCNPAATGQATQDGSQANPYTSLVTAYSATRNAMNDIVLLVGNGGTGATARVDASFTWSNSATHLIGYCSPVMFSQRARLAPSAATTAFTPFFTISGSGCLFQNIQWFDGFTTGTTAQICMVLTGSRNAFINCAIDGMGDTTSATSSTSRTLKIGVAGAGENYFESCSIGIDTVARTGANATIELTGDATRNLWRSCVFPVYAGDANPLVILGTGNACCDRFNMFDRCLFTNAIASGATQMTVLGSFTTASPGGGVLFKDSPCYGMTKYGDTNFLANSAVDMPAVSTSGGLMHVPA